MRTKERPLSEQVADTILSMITVEGRLKPGDKLPNENEFSAQLNVSRTTLREAVRMLAARGVLEIYRGKGTFVAEESRFAHPFGMDNLSQIRMNLKDLYEIRLMFEPQAAYYAAQRATSQEIERILSFGAQEEALIKAGKDRTQAERSFHNAIARATHNEFMEKLMPILYRAIDQCVQLSEEYAEVVAHTLADHRLIMEFISARDPLGAKAAMELHMIHAMRGFGIAEEPSSSFSS